MLHRKVVITVDKKNIKFDASDIEVQSSTNKMYIIGCIATIDTASQGPPCGADGHNLVISKKSVDKCAASFKGMPINCVFETWGYSPANFTGHGEPGYDLYFGYLEDVWAQDSKLMAKIVVWKDAFPELAFTIINAQRSLGFSVELYPTQLHEAENGDYILDEFEGVGCALLWRKCAAFGEDTYIEKLIASLAKKGNGDADMTEKEMKDLAALISAEVNKAVDEKIGALGIDKLQAAVDEIKATDYTGKFDEITKGMQDMVADNMKKDERFAELKASIDKFANIPKPKNTVSDPVFGDSKADGFMKRFKEIEASSMSMFEKLKAKAQLEMEADKEGVVLESLRRKLW